MATRLMERSDFVREAQKLREKGWKIREIAGHFGVSRTTAGTWLSDPDLSKQQERRKRYQRPCATCGDLMTGSEGLGPNAPLHCRKCAGPASRKWTEEAVIAAMHHFERIRKRSPVATDWNPALARQLGMDDRADLFDLHDEWPHVGTVQSLFGSWNEGVRAAGFEPNGPGQRPTDWTEDELLAAIRRWVSMYGEPPRQSDWNPWQGNSAQVKRFESGNWPHVRSLTYRWGSWNKAIEAAGFTPRRSGGQPKVVAEVAA